MVLARMFFKDVSIMHSHTEVNVLLPLEVQTHTMHNMDLCLLGRVVYSHYVMTPLRSVAVV